MMAFTLAIRESSKRVGVRSLIYDSYRYRLLLNNAARSDSSTAIFQVLEGPLEGPGPGLEM